MIWVYVLSALLLLASIVVLNMASRRYRASKDRTFLILVILAIAAFLLSAAGVGVAAFQLAS